MARFRNEAQGARAVRLRDRSYILVDAGEESGDIAESAIKSVHPDLARIDKAPAKKPDKRAMLEAMGDDDIRAFVEKLTGKKPHHNAKRETLIERALA